MVAGTMDGVLMVESEADELPEDVMLGAVTFGHQHLEPVIQAIISLAEQAAKKPGRCRNPSMTPRPCARQFWTPMGRIFRAAYGEKKKQVRYQKVGAVRTRVFTEMKSDALPKKPCRSPPRGGIRNRTLQHSGHRDPH